MSEQRKYPAQLDPYSEWHRTDSIKRFFNNDAETAMKLSMIDIDGVLWVEWEKVGRMPVALIESARYVVRKDGRDNKDKCSHALHNLGVLSCIRTFVLLYETQPNQHRRDVPDISRLLVLQVMPPTWADHNGNPEWRTVSPAQWARYLLKLRETESPQVASWLDRYNKLIESDIERFKLIRDLRQQALKTGCMSTGDAA